MTALGDIVSDEDRARLERARELAALDRLIREIPAQRPPAAPPALAALAVRDNPATSEEAP